MKNDHRDSHNAFQRMRPLATKKVRLCEMKSEKQKKGVRPFPSSHFSIFIFHFSFFIFHSHRSPSAAYFERPWSFAAPRAAHQMRSISTSIIGERLFLEVLLHLGKIRV
ncbi:MAG TPA: hypothetical protein VH370_16605 [Humisphaera sp.]|nr:hypothetical protein [Humisphaera sp.]